MVSAAATSAFQLEHTSRLLHSVCPGGYQIQTIEYGKMLVMLVSGEYYGRVYEVYVIVTAQVLGIYGSKLTSPRAKPEDKGGLRCHKSLATVLSLIYPT